MFTSEDKTEAKQTLATLLDMNEPEALVSSMRLMCERKTEDRFITDTERNRWSHAAEALAEVLLEMEPAKKADAPLNEEAKAE
jgi:hypothetical protein